MSEFGVKNINILSGTNAQEALSEVSSAKIKNVWGQSNLPDLLKESCSIPQPQNAALQLAVRMDKMMGKDKYLKDDVLEFILEEMKQNKVNVFDFLEYFRIANKDGIGFLDLLRQKKQISSAVVEKYEKYFTEELEAQLGFDRKLERKGISSEFKSGDYTYQSDKYDVVQKSEHILEIKNLSTNEKKIIDFKNLVPEGLNGINDIIALKSCIQKLPPAILFRIPDEVSVIKDTNVEILQNRISGDSDEKMDYEGSVAYTEDGHELILTSDFPETMVHEIAHTVFLDKDGNDTLYNNPQVVSAFKKAIEKFEQDGNLRYEKGDIFYDSSSYWSTDLSDFGAEVVTSVFMHNYSALESLQKYAPDAFKLVMEHFENRQYSNDKHSHYNYNDLFKDSK